MQLCGHDHSRDDACDRYKDCCILYLSDNYSLLWETVGSRLDSQSRDTRSSPGGVIVLFSWTRQLNLTVLRLAANCQEESDEMLVVTCDGLTFHTGGVAMLETRIKIYKYLLLRVLRYLKLNELVNSCLVCATMYI